LGYRTVFDVTQVGSQWEIGAVCILAGAVLLVLGWGLRSTGASVSFKSSMFLIVGAGAILAGVLITAVKYTEHRTYERGMREGSCSTVEGTVSDFRPMPSGGHSLESFKINGAYFEYGSGWGSTTFNSNWNNGFIRDGVQARITFSDDKAILKVETK